MMAMNIDNDCDTIVNFVIMKAYPDYKRPSINHYYGQCKKSELKDILLEDLYEFIIDNCCDEQTIIDKGYFDGFIDNFYKDSYMSNEPYEVKAVINNCWTDVTPKESDIIEYLKNKLKENELDE